MRLICNDVAGTTVASSLMDKQGRKSLLLISFTGMVLLPIKHQFYIFRISLYKLIKSDTVFAFQSGLLKECLYLTSDRHCIFSIYSMFLD